MPPKRKAGKSTQGVAGKKRARADEDAETALGEAGEELELEVPRKRAKGEDAAEAGPTSTRRGRGGGAAGKKKVDSEAEPDTEGGVPEAPAKTTGTASSSGDFSSTATTKSGLKWNLKISSWNVNGVRAWLSKGGAAFIGQENPDILVLQETKCSESEIPKEARHVTGYHSYWLSGDKDGYSGVGLFTKVKPLNVNFGMGIAEHDNEGRMITAEYEEFYLIGAYVPNSGRGLPRLAYRQQWDKDFLKYIKDLDAKKPVVYCGDLNVSHQEIDLANPKSNTKSAGFTKEEREGFSQLLKAGFVDSFRHLYPKTTGAYTFWTYMGNARAKNVGWRLDYFVLSERLVENLCDSVIRPQVMGSDHCPITVFLAM